MLAARKPVPKSLPSFLLWKAAGVSGFRCASILLPSCRGWQTCRFSVFNLHAGCVGGLALLSSTRPDQQNRTAQLLFQILTRVATQVFSGEPVRLEIDGEYVRRSISPSTQQE